MMAVHFLGMVLCLPKMSQIQKGVHIFSSDGMTFSKILQRGYEINSHLAPGGTKISETVSEGDEKIEGLKSETTTPVLKC